MLLYPVEEGSDAGTEAAGAVLRIEADGELQL